MMNRFGLDRFKKATSVEPFSVTQKPSPIPAIPQPQQFQRQASASQQLPQPQPPQFAVPARIPGGAKAPDAAATAASAANTATTLGAGGSTWQPPDWATEPKSAAFFLDVMKDGEVVDKINLDKKRLIFGRQQVMCDLVLDHPSVSRQHAAVVHHKNGGIYVIDLGSVHGTFVANEHLNKDNPVELEVGQSLRFAASTRIYVLRRAPVSIPVGIPSAAAAAQASLRQTPLPPRPDPSDVEGVLAYNTTLNRLGIVSPFFTNPTSSSNVVAKSGVRGLEEGEGGQQSEERPRKKSKGNRVSFRDDYGGSLAEVVGVSDGADVSTEPVGPVGVREGSLVGKYESLVQVTVIPKGKEEENVKKAEAGGSSSQGITQRLQQYLDKVKSPAKVQAGSLYDGDMYGESRSGLAGGSWATVENDTAIARATEAKAIASIDGIQSKPSKEVSTAKAASNENAVEADRKTIPSDPNFSDDDLFGEEDDT